MIKDSNNNIPRFLMLLFILIDLLNEVTAKLCKSGKVCDSCCGETCCDNDDDDDSQITYQYRISFWNLWYFWFVILFILMSCFGGCGYYKQRQRLAQSQGTYFRTTRPVNRRNNGAVMVDTTLPNYYAYSGPAADIPHDITLQPPPYAEVVSQPGTFPANKIDLPPYPGYPGYAGAPIVTADQTGNYAPSSGVEEAAPPAPPPYQEYSTNQNSEISNQTVQQQSNQNAERT